MKIAIFTETFLPKIDGMVTITCLLLDHLRRVDAEVTLFVSGKRVSEYAGYPVVSMPGVPAPMYPELQLALPGRSVYRQLRDFDPDLIHIMNPVMSGLRAIEYAYSLDKPLVMSFHTHLMEMARFYGYGVFEGTLWALHRLAYGYSDRVLVTSKRMAEDLDAHGIANPWIWRRGVDVERFSPDYASDDMRSRLTDNQPDRTILLSVGRLAPEKQVEQIRHTLECVPNVHLAIIGDGPHRKHLESVYAGYPVTFVGYMTGHDLSVAYASADLFVFPSSSIETFGLVAAEAMASGTPVVASRVGGMPEIIVDGQNGYLFDENDTATMTQRVRELVENPAKREQFGIEARQTMQSLGWTAIMDELFVLYREMIVTHATKQQRDVQARLET
jgi:glycosyltransferase involved in cell wall biosynthesis